MLRWRLLCSAAFVGALVLTQVPGSAQPPPGPPGAPGAPRPRLDVGKGSIEIGPKRVLGQFGQFGQPGGLPPGPMAPPAPVLADNPKVAPGKVAWHPDLAAACAASAKSKKPVLLFQMMGKLDEQFC